MNRVPQKALTERTALPLLIIAMSGRYQANGHCETRAKLEPPFMPTTGPLAGSPHQHGNQEAIGATPPALLLLTPLPPLGTGFSAPLFLAGGQGGPGRRP